MDNLETGPEATGLTCHHFHAHLLWPLVSPAGRSGHTSNRLCLSTFSLDWCGPIHNKLRLSLALVLDLSFPELDTLQMAMQPPE